MRWVSGLNPPVTSWEIVGVAGDIHQANLDHEPVPEIYLSLSQAGADGAGYVIRARSDDASLPPAIARVVAALDPRIQRVNVESLALMVERNLEGRSAAIRLVGGFGILAVLLTAAGIYGIVSFRAAERSHELAIRSALGATAPQLRALVLAHGARLAIYGAVAGLAGFAGVLPLLRGQLYGISALDPPSIAGVTLAVVVVALLAGLGPSWRAGRRAPLDLLRDL